MIVFLDNTSIIDNNSRSVKQLILRIFAEFPPIFPKDNLPPRKYNYRVSAVLGHVSHITHIKPPKNKSFPGIVGRYADILSANSYDSAKKTNHGTTPKEESLKKALDDLLPYRELSIFLGIKSPDIPGYSPSDPSIKALLLILPSSLVSLFYSR